MVNIFDLNVLSLSTISLAWWKQWKLIVLIFNLDLSSQTISQTHVFVHFVVLRLDLPVLWFDFHLVLLQNPSLWLPKAVEGRLEMPSYREPCQRYCVTQGEPVSCQMVAEA